MSPYGSLAAFPKCPDCGKKFDDHYSGGLCSECSAAKKLKEARQAVIDAAKFAFSGFDTSEESLDAMDSLEHTVRKLREARV